jgi:hypothetical protein
MASSTLNIFFLGATGFLSGELLLLLARDYPACHIRALLRNPSAERVAKLRELNPNLSIVEGDLNDAQIIINQAATADIVINSASSDHWPSVKGMSCSLCYTSQHRTHWLSIATLDGLEKNSANRPGKPPLYIHVSGCGILSDNARGEKVESVKVWSDIGLDLKEFVHSFWLICDT